MTDNNKPTNIAKAFESSNAMAQKTEDTKREYVGIDPEQYSTSDWRNETQGLTSITGTHNIKRSDYDKHLDRVYANRDIDKQRAEAQGFGGELASALGQLPFRIVGDVISMAGIVPEALDGDLFQAMTGSTEVDFGNSLLDLGMGISDWSQEAFPIYKMNPGSTIGDQFSGEWDSAYWANIIPEAVSTVADLFVSKGALTFTKAIARQGTKALTRKMATKQLKAMRKNIASDINQKMAMPGVSQATKETLEQSSKYTEDILSRTLRNENFKSARDNMFAAYIGRHFEAGLEAAQLEEESKFLIEETDFKDIIKEPGYKEYKKEFGKAPTKQEYAKYVGTKAGKRAYQLNMANMMWDFAQLSSMGSFMGKGSTLKVKTKQAEMLGRKLTKGQKLRYRATPFLRTGASGVTEAIEEGWNFMATEEGRHLFKGLTDEDYESARSDRFKQYLKNDQFWESAFMGFVGSSIMTPALGRKAFLQDTTDRLNSLDRRKTQLALLAKKTAEIESNTELNDVAKTTMKRMLARNFVSGVAIDAAANGNSKETIGYFSSPEFKKELIDDKGFTEQEATDHVNDIVGTVRHAEKIFQNAKKWDILGKSFRGKNKDAKIQNQVINTKIMEKMNSFNLNEAYEKTKQEVEDYIGANYDSDTFLFEDITAVETKALSNLQQKYFARASALAGRISELQRKEKKSKKGLKSQEKQELLDLERLQKDYTELANKFMERAEQFNLTTGIAEATKAEAGQEVKPGADRNRGLSDQKLIELIEDREQYKVNSKYAQDQSENEKRIIERSEEDLAVIEKNKGEVKDKLIKEIEEINAIENLDAYLAHPDKDVQKAAIARQKKLNKDNEVVGKANKLKEIDFDNIGVQNEDGSVTFEEENNEKEDSEEEEEGESTTQESNEEIDSIEKFRNQTLPREKVNLTGDKYIDYLIQNDTNINDPGVIGFWKLEYGEEEGQKYDDAIINNRDLINREKEKWQNNKTKSKIESALRKADPTSVSISEKVGKQYVSRNSKVSFKNIEGIFSLEETTPNEKGNYVFLNKETKEKYELPLNYVSRIELLGYTVYDEKIAALKEKTTPKKDTKKQETKLTEKQNKTINTLVANSNKIKKVVIEFKQNSEGDFLDEKGNILKSDGQKVILSARVVTDPNEKVEYQGYIVDDGNLPILSTGMLPSSQYDLLQERATSFIEKPNFGRPGNRKQGKFLVRDKFKPKFRPSGKIGTRIDDMGREVLDYFTENGISEEIKLAAKKAMKAKYAVRGDKEMFSTKENVSQKIINETINHLVDRFAKFFEDKVIKEGKYIIPAEIMVAGAGYAGTTDITLVDKNGNIEIGDMKTYRNTGSKTVRINNIIGYKNQLNAYADAIELTNPEISVNSLGIFAMGINWKDESAGFETKDRGLLQSPEYPDNAKDAELMETTGIEEGSTNNYFVIKRESINNNPDPDKGSKNNNQSNIQQERNSESITTDNSFFFHLMKEAKTVAAKLQVIAKHHNAITELENAVAEGRDRLEGLIKVSSEPGRNNQLTYRIYVGDYNIGGISVETSPEIKQIIQNIQRNEIKVKQFASDIKKSIVDSLLAKGNQKATVTNGRSMEDVNRYKPFKQGLKLLFPVGTSMTKRNLKNEEIDYLFESMQMADAHSFNKGERPLLSTNWNRDAEDTAHTGSGAQMLFTFGQVMNSSIATIKYSKTGMVAVAKLIHKRIKEKKATAENAARLNNMLSNIFGPRVDKKTGAQLPKFIVEVNTLGENSSFVLRSPEGELINSEDIEKTLSELFLNKDFAVKPIVVSSVFGVSKNKSSEVVRDSDLRRILFEYGETNMIDLFPPLKNITIRTNVPTENAKKIKQPKPTQKVKENKGLIPLELVKKQTPVEDTTPKKPEQTKSTRITPTEDTGSDVGDSGAGLELYLDESTSKNKEFDLEKFDTFKSWFKENLPSIPIEVVENIISRTGVRAFGTFYNNAIKLAENAPLGTGYHEAYHFVHNSLLTGAERIEMISEAKKVYPAPNGQDMQSLRSKYPYLSNDDITDIYYEEQLAEDFRKYKVTKDSNDTKSSKLKQLFDKILDFLKSFVSRNNNRKIQRLFKKIDSGNFKNAAISNNRLDIALDKPLESFGNNRNQEKFADSVVNFVYSNYKVMSDYKRAGIVKEKLSSSEAYNKIIGEYKVDDPVDATKLMLFGVFHDKSNSKNLSKADSLVIKDMLLNDFEKFFTIVENKLYNYYGMEYTSTSGVRDIENQDTEVHENNDQDLVQKDWADETSLKEKPSKSMSKTLKKIMRNSPKLTTNKIEGKYIADHIDEIRGKVEGRKYQTMADLKKDILENYTEKSFGLVSYTNFTRLNKFLERRLANINTMDDMTEALKHASKVFDDVSSVYFSIMDSDNKEVWFEHFKKNAYVMVSSQKITKEQNVQQATYIANRESGFLEVAKNVNRRLYSNFDKIKSDLLKDVHDGENFKLSGDNLDAKLIELLNLGLGFSKAYDYGDESDKDFFLLAMGAIPGQDSSLRLPHNKHRNILDNARAIVEEIVRSEKDSNNINGYLDNIAELAKDYQWITNSNFRVDGKGLYGISKGNMLTEKFDEINDLYSSNQGIVDEAINKVNNMRKDPHVKNSNWQNKFFKVAVGSVAPINDFLGIRYGVYNTFNGIEYSDWTENDVDHMHFTEFLSDYKRGGQDTRYYNQILPTQSDSTTPYFIGVPKFGGNDILPAFKQIMKQEIARIKHVVEGYNDGKIHKGNLPKNAMRQKDNDGETIYKLDENAPIFKVTSLPYFDQLFPEVDGLRVVTNDKNNYVVAPLDESQLEEAVLEYLGKLKIKIKNNFNKKNHLQLKSEFAKSHNFKDSEILNQWILFELNYIINANEVQNLFTGKEYEFKSREDKSKRGKNPSANGVVNQPSNDLKIKKVDSNGKVSYVFRVKENATNEIIEINKDDFKKEKHTKLTNTIEIITLKDIVGRADKDTAQEIYNRTKDIFGRKEALRAINAHGWDMVGGELTFNSDDAKAYDKGDAGSYMTWQRFEQLQRNRGKVHSGSKLDKIFNKFRDGKSLTQEDYQELSAIIAVEKPYYGDRKVNEETELMESHMLKFGITVLFPELVKGTKLEQIADFMERKGIAEAHFSSAQKIGQTMELDLNEFHENSGMNFEDFFENKRAEAIKEIKGDFNKAKIDGQYNPFATTLDLTKYRIQLENPDHTVDTDNLLGTQFAKLIMSNISSDAVYNLYNPATKEYEKKTGQEIIDAYSTNYATDVSEAMEELLEEIGGKIEIVDKETGEYKIAVKDPKKLAEILSKELDKKDEMPDNVKAFLELNEDGEFAIPLNYSPRKNDFQSIILSMFTKRVNKLRMPGFSGALVSSVFFENTNAAETKGVEWISEQRNSKVLRGERIDPNTGEILPAEILVKRTQSWMNGKTIDEISKIPGALEAIGYRIPTEAKSSMVRVKIVGFLPDSTKATVIVPDSLVPKMGSDFDIDKLFFMQRKYGETKGGKVFRYTLEEGKNKKDRSYGRKNNMYDSFDAILSSDVHFAELMSPQGFDDLSDAAKNTKKESDKEALNHNLYGANKEFRKRNMDGKQTLGIAASANPTNSLFQILKTKLMEDGEVIPVTIIDTSGTQRDLSQLSNYEDYKTYLGDSYVTMQSAQGVGASADAAKDPTTTFIGLNPGNFATYQAMIMLGIPISEAFYLTRQPIFDYYGRGKGNNDVYSEIESNNKSKDHKLFSALLDAKGEKFETSRDKNKRIKELMDISRKEGYDVIDLQKLKSMEYDVNKVNIEEQARLLNAIKEFEKIGNHISNFTSATKPEGFGTGKDSFATALKMFSAMENRGNSLIQASYDQIYPNTRMDNTIVSGKNIKHSNLTNDEIFDYFYKINQDEIKETDCGKGGSSAPKARNGMRESSFQQGFEWKVVKDLKGHPSHAKGGVDVEITDSGVTLSRKDGKIKAKYGLVIPFKK